MPKALDITNQKFGKLTAIQKVQSKKGKTYWLCKCECGNEKEIQTSHLMDGRTKSCGCGFLEEDDNIRQCEICGKNFYIKFNGVTRKYCYDCSPSYSDNERAQSIIAIRKAMKQEAVKRCGGKCSICGYNKSLRALEFHHKDPKEKDFGLSANGSVHSWAKYWEEVQKCILVCSNCHAEIHELDEE